MKYIKILLLLLIGLVTKSQAQNPNIVPGTQATYTIAGREVLIWCPVDTTSFKKYSTLVSFVGNSTNNSAAALGQGPAKRISTSTTGIHRDSFFVITVIRTVGENNNVMGLAAFDNILDTITKYNKYLDTTRFHATGLSQGAQEVYRYLSDASRRITGYSPKHQTWFKNQVYNSPGAWDVIDFNVFRVTNTWVSWGTADAVTGTFWPSYMFQQFSGTGVGEYGYIDPKTKKIEISGAGHTSTVWDSTWSIAGANANNNTWKWLLSVTFGLSNASPSANAGLTQTLYSGTSTTLNGTGSYDPDGTIVTYAWTQISGASTTIGSPSSASTSVTGLSTGYYRFRLVVTDNNGATSSDTVSVVLTSPRHRINVRQGDVFRSGGRTSILPVQNLWDNDTLTSISAEFVTAIIDIPCEAWYMLPDSLYDNVTFEFWNLGFAGGTNTKWTLYNETFTDSVIAYKSINISQWNVVDSNTTKGAHFPVRYIKLDMDQALRGMTEMRVYGTNKALAAPVFPPEQPNPTPLPYEEFQATAINGDENDSLLVGAISIFEARWFWDSTLTYNSAARTMVASVYGDALPQLLSYRNGGKKTNFAFVMSIRAFQTPPPTNPTNYGSYDENIKNIVPGSDTTDPATWLASAQEGFLLTTYAGRATGINRGPHSLKTLGVEATQGNDVVVSMEADNEDDAFWSTKRYQNSKVRAAKISAFADGHMGALGPYAGVKTADPTMKIASGARVGLDSISIKSDAFFLYKLRGYNNNPIDIYYTNQYFVYGGSQQTGTNGISPGQFDWAGKAKWYASLRNRYFPGKRIGIREFGWDIRQGTYYSALAHGSLDSFTVQANYGVLAYNIGRANGVDMMYWYRSRNEEPFDTPLPGAFGTSGQFYYIPPPGGIGPYIPVRMKSSYWVRTNFNMLKRYDNLYPDIIQEGDSTGLYIYRYRNASPTDTVTVFLASGTHNDSYFSYNLTVGNTTFCEKVEMAMGDDDGVHTTVTPVGGVLNLTGIGETPIYIRYVPSGVSIPNGFLRWRRKLFSL